VGVPIVSPVGLVTFVVPAWFLHKDVADYQIEVGLIQNRHVAKTISQVDIAATLNRTIGCSDVNVPHNCILNWRDRHSAVFYIRLCVANVSNSSIGANDHNWVVVCRWWIASGLMVRRLIDRSVHRDVGGAREDAADGSFFIAEQDHFNNGCDETKHLFQNPTQEWDIAQHALNRFDGLDNVVYDRIACGVGLATIGARTRRREGG
jgi:hypothetical protein